MLCGSERYEFELRSLTDQNSTNSYSGWNTSHVDTMLCLMTVPFTPGISNVSCQPG